MLKMMKNGNNKKGSSILKLTIFALAMSILIIVLATPSYASILENEDIKWSEDGNTYRLTQTDNMVTEKDYTIKAVEFPFAVRGYRTINDGIYPERPVSPFVKFELYKDIINNTKPIDTFTIGTGDEYIISDQETRITINEIPGSTSQDWVYEYYNPWVVIKIQNRAIPNLDISISLINPSGDSIDEEDMRSGSDIDAKITIKNTGNDFIDDVVFNIDHGKLLAKDTTTTDKLSDTISRLNKDEEKVIDISLTIPVSLEEKEYKIQVNTAGKDVKDVIYNFNASKIVKTKSDIDAIYVEKRVSRNTSYLKEYVGVVLNIVNTGHTTISNVQIHDAIPDRLIFIKDGVIQNYTEFSLNKSSLGPSESWTIDYSLKPKEPGIYILPKFDTNFSIEYKNYSATAGEVGFRVFGPHVILTKSVMEMGKGLIDVIVKAKNIGNGPTRVVITDKLSSDTELILGSMNSTMYLDIDAEKVMNYTVKTSVTNISNITWKPANATYYLDDWKFYTSSDEKYEEGHRVEEGHPLEGGTRAHIIILPPVVTETTYPEVTVPKIKEEQKKVVATIPVKTPVQEKSIPGFVLYDSILLSIVVILSRRKNMKK